MPFWNTNEIIPFLHELAERQVRKPIQVAFTDNDKIITSITVNTTSQYGGKRGRNSQSITISNDLLKHYNYFSIRDIDTKIKIFADHFANNGYPYMLNEGKSHTVIYLLKGGIRFGDFRSLVNHFITLYP